MFGDLPYLGPENVPPVAVPFIAPLDFCGGALSLALHDVRNFVPREPRDEVELSLQMLDLALQMQFLVQVGSLLRLELQKV